MYINEFLELLSLKTGHQPKKSRESYVTLCPSHDDHNPSLSVSESKEQNILIHCHAGCDNVSICDRLGVKLSDLFQKNDSNPVKRIKTEYLYVDDSGKVVYKKIRIEPGYEGKDKSFFISSLDPKGFWINKSPKHQTRFLYRLDEVKTGIEKGKKIYLVEGEKDVEKLR